MLAHRLLGGGRSSLSVSCPSLGSTLMAAARARLWSSFRQRSESTLLARCETKGKKKSLASSAAADLFLDSLPASTEARASAPSPRPPRRLSRQASQVGECWSAPILHAGISPLCPPHPCGCALLCGSEASPLRHPQSLPAKGLPSVWKPFLLHSSLPLVQVPSLFFCLCYFFFLLPYPSTWGVSCLLGGLTSSASVQ